MKVTEDAREEINKALSEYVDSTDRGIYASLIDNGRVQLDGYFEIEDIKELLAILMGNRFF